MPTVMKAMFAVMMLVGAASAQQTGGGGGAPGGNTGGACANALTMNGSGSGAAPGTSFNCSAATTLSYNTLGAAPLAGPSFTGPVASAGTVTVNNGVMNVVSVNQAKNEYDFNGAAYFAQTLSSNQYLFGDLASDIDVIWNSAHKLNFGISFSPPLGFFDGSGFNANAIGATTPGTIVGTSIAAIAARRGTFTCTAGGTITIANANYAVTSDVVITMHTAGGTITTSPAFKTVTAGTGFSVLCGATDTSVYNYSIMN